MVHLNLDPQGRLIEFSAVPPQLEETPASPQPADWTPLLSAAGLDMSRFALAEPHWLPLVSFDARSAWTGSYANAPEIPLAHRGRILARKTGEFPGDWSVVETGKDAAGEMDRDRSSRGRGCNLPAYRRRLPGLAQSSPPKRGYPRSGAPGRLYFRSTPSVVAMRSEPRSDGSRSPGVSGAD